MKKSIESTVAIVVGVVAIAVIWSVTAFALNDEMMMPAPSAVAKEFIAVFGEKSTYKSINSTISVGKDSLENDVEAEKIYEAVNACYAKSGKTLVHHAGHLIDKTPIAEPRFIAGEKRKVKSGNVYAIESGLYDGFGIRLENDFYLSESGAEDLSDKFMPLADVESYIIGK